MPVRLLGDPLRALLSKPKMARGCELCFAGAKAVIFVTGLCDDGCYYCPVSRAKLGFNLFYVNEEPVTSIEDAILEVARTGARGASITGGDPLLAYNIVIALVEKLKESFGSQFHIHLYTSGRYATPEVLVHLDRAGLDEIRFHPTRPEFMSRARIAKQTTGMSVGIEIPIGPGLVEWAKKLIAEADRLGLDFVNLNELEFVEPNAKALLARGLRESRERPFTVEGALKAAYEVVAWAAENVSIPVHFCPAAFKDSIQTRNRLRSTSSTDRGWHEIPTAQGTLVREEWKDGCRIQIEAYPTRARKPIVSVSKTCS